MCAEKLEFEEGRGVYFVGQFWKIQKGKGGGGAYEISLLWVGYGYFLEPHNEYRHLVVLNFHDLLCHKHLV